VIDWLISTTPLFKAVHIAGLAMWCAGLLALPLMLARHDPSMPLVDYRLMRRASHITYASVVTPAAVLTVIAGTWLIFLRETFTPWLYAKLVFVALLVAAHGWIGHGVVQIGENPSEHTPPPSYLPIIAVMIPVLAILYLVLAKPGLGWISIPDWLTAPRENQSFFEVPN
jgi:protoporphyrinogen IX oxidase